MADISILNRLLNGLNRNVDISANTLVTTSVKVGGGITNTELTKSILDRLVSLQNGTDVNATYHTHNTVYNTTTSMASTTIGSSGAKLVGVSGTPVNHVPATADVQGYLNSIDSALATAGLSDFSDSVFRVSDNVTPSKKIAFQASGISASTVRTITMPDADVDLGALVNANISASAAIAYSKLSLSGSLVNADVSSGAAIAYSKLALANGIVNADINTAAAIAYSKLSLALSVVNADIATGAAIAYSKLSLTGAILNADLAGSIAYSKLSLTGAILNADLAGSIAHSKMVALSFNKAIATDASGFAVASTTSDVELGYVAGVTSAIQTQLNAKASLAGATFTGAVDFGANRVQSSYVPTAATDLVNKAFTDGLSVGLQWQNPILDSHVVDDSLTAPPGSPNIEDAYIVAASPTGAWAGLAGRLLRWDGAAWQDQLGRVIAINDRYGIDFYGPTPAGGGFTGQGKSIAVVTNATPGSYAYTFSAPFNQEAVTVVNAASSENGHAYTYSGTLVSWIEFFSGSSVIDGAGLLYTGNTLNIVAADSTITVSPNSIQVGSNSLTNSHINSAAAIAYSKLALSNSIVNADIASAAAIAYSKLALTGAILNADLAGSIAYSKLALTGAILNADLAGSIAYSKLSLASSIVNTDIAVGAAIAYSKLALTGAILNADLAGSIAYSKLVLTGAILDADLAGSIAYSKLVLSNSVVNADIATSAAIAYSKLNLSASVVNADIATGAAIAYSKLALSNSVAVGDLTTGVADQVTILGGNGTALNVAQAPKLVKSMVAGATFTASTSYVVRMAMSGETAGRFYAADDDTSVSDKFHVVGMMVSAGLTAGQSASIVITGSHDLGASDAPFAAGDIGKPVYLTAAGAFSITPPSVALSAIVKVGVVETTTRILVNGQIMGVN